MRRKKFTEIQKQIYYDKGMKDDRIIVINHLKMIKHRGIALHKNIDFNSQREAVEYRIAYKVLTEIIKELDNPKGQSFHGSY